MKRSPLELALLVGVLLFSLILAIGFRGLGKRVGSVEKATSSTRKDWMRGDEDLSGRVGALSKRLEANEEEMNLRAATTSRLKREFDDLKAEVASAEKKPRDEATLTALRDLEAEVRALKSDIARIRTLAEASGKEQAAPAGGGVAPEDLAAVSTRLDAIDSRIGELERKPTSKGADVKINEQALRQTVNEIVKEEVNRMFEEMRNARGTRRRPPGGE